MGTIPLTVWTNYGDGTEMMSVCNLGKRVSDDLFPQCPGSFFYDMGRRGRKSGRWALASEVCWLVNRDVRCEFRGLRVGSARRGRSSHKLSGRDTSCGKGETPIAICSNYRAAEEGLTLAVPLVIGIIAGDKHLDSGVGRCGATDLGGCRLRNDRGRGVVIGTRRRGIGIDHPLGSQVNAEAAVGEDRVLAD